MQFVCYVLCHTNRTFQRASRMYVKAKQRGAHTEFFLCIAERGGNAGRGAKSVEYSVCLGRTLDLAAEEWLEILARSEIFQGAPLAEVLEAAQRYAAENNMPMDTLAGLNEAVRGAKRARRTMISERRSQQDERAAALFLLGLSPGASKRAIESAFRKAAQRCHPDRGGDAAKFRELVSARNLLLGSAGVNQIR